MAGYSKRTLSQKLGIKMGDLVYLQSQPPEYLQTLDLPEAVEVKLTLSSGLNLIQVFVDTKEEVEKQFKLLSSYLLPNGSFWVSWRKQGRQATSSRKLQQNQGESLNENTIREVGLANGMVDVKVIAVDRIWSGLKFVYRLKDRS